MMPGVGHASHWNIQQEAAPLEAITQRYFHLTARNLPKLQYKRVYPWWVPLLPPPHPMCGIAPLF